MARDASNYNTCLYCGRVNGYANPMMPAYCNLGCQFKARDNEPLSSEEWERNFESSLIEFDKKRQERFSQARKPTDKGER